MCCEVDNHSYMTNIRAKWFSDLNFNQAVLDKTLIFKEITPNFTYPQNYNFSSITETF